MLGADLGPRVVAAVGGVGDEIFGLIARHGIDCDPVRRGWLQPAFSAPTLALVARRCEQWARRGAPVGVLDRAQMASFIGSDHYLGGWEDRRGGNIQPLSFARGLAAAAGARRRGHLRALAGDVASPQRQPLDGDDTDAAP